MNVARLRRLGNARKAAKREYDRAHSDALDVLVDELAGDDDANVAEAARLIGVTRRTVYNALDRAVYNAEREARDNGAAPPAPAPHDTDRRTTR